MATVVGPSFKVGGAEFEPPGFATASQADRDLYWNAVLKLVLKAKDSELKAGLDRYGKPMHRLAASTIANRRSAMGPADPGAPPLQPAHGLSRTRSLLTGKATASGVVCWWLVDKHTGATWGAILKHHRAGLGKLPRRDVIGLSPEAKAQVRSRAFTWWEKHLAKVHGFDFAVGSAHQVAEAQQPGGQWSGWHTEAQVDAALAAKGVKYDEATGTFDYADFWAAIKAKKKGPPPPPPTPPPASPFAPKPPKPKKKAAPKKKAQAAAPPTPAPAAPTTPVARKKAAAEAWPAALADLVEVKTLGGSTGAKLVMDPKTGRRYVLKRGGNPGHLKSEAQADALYRAAGIEVPDSRLYDDGGPVKLAVFHEGKSLGELKSSDPAAYEAACEKLREGFAVDALLGNWDVVGMNLDNVLVLPDGRVLRIDNGGSLAYRAQGSPKTANQWDGKAVLELETLRHEGTNRQTFGVFGKLHDDELRPRLAALAARRAELLAAADDPKLKAVLSGRLDDLERWSRPAAGSHEDGFVPTPADRFRRFASDAERLDWIEKHYGDGATSRWWAALSAEERKAVEDYSGSGYHDYNDWHRGKLPRKPPNIDRRTALLDAALAKMPVPEGVVMYRGIKDAAPVYQALGLKGREDLRVGMDLTDRGYSSASPNILKAWEAYGDPFKDLQMEIRLPPGMSGAYFGKKSSVSTEEEFLLGRGYRYRIVDVGPKWITVEAVKLDDVGPKKRGRKKP